MAQYPITIIRHIFSCKTSKTSIKIIFLFVFYAFNILDAQDSEKENTHPYIKSIVFKGKDKNTPFPLLLKHETLILEFDDLNAKASNYYYEIVHCDYRWNPSLINKNQYIDGFDNQRIIDYFDSRNTLQGYTHYSLSIPNAHTKIKLTGNYLLIIRNDLNEIIFTRKFLVYQNKLNVALEIKRSRELKYINSHQVVHFSIEPIQNLFNSKENIKVRIFQNYNWDTALEDIAPQYVSSTKFIYKYDQKTAFEAGNEYLYYENKYAQSVGNGIQSVTSNSERLQYILFPNHPRWHLPYDSQRDINGDFVFSETNLQAFEALDYGDVLFSLKAKSPSSEKIKYFVYGNFNNYQLETENRLDYNPNTKSYSTKIRLKQGFYNYKYVALREGKLYHNAICGNFWQTENIYTVVIYHTNASANYDEIIGMGSMSSLNIKN